MQINRNLALGVDQETMQVFDEKEFLVPEYEIDLDENGIFTQEIFKQNVLLPLLEKKCGTIKFFINKLSKEWSPNFEDLQFQTQVKVEYAKLIQFEIEEQVWFDNLKAEIEKKLSAGMLEYSMRELLGADYDLELNPTEITLNNDAVKLEAMKNEKVKVFLDGMFLVFVGKPELYKDDKFLNEQIYHFWMNLNFAFETDRYDESVKVGQLPKAYLEITIILSPFATQ